MFAPIPRLGAAAYLLAPSMRKSAPVIGALAIDGVAHKAPFRLYYRLRIGRLTAYVVKRRRAERRHFPVTLWGAKILSAPDRARRHQMGMEFWAGTGLGSVDGRLALA